MKIFRKYVLFGLIVFLGKIGNSQVQLLDSLQLDSVIPITSLAEALQNPDAVIKLELRKQKYKTFPTAILKFKNLQYLDLSKNSIKNLPDSIELLTNLQYLNVSRNSLESVNKNIGKLLNLRYVNFNNNDLESLPPQIGYLENLQVLDLWSNNLDDFPETLANLKNLKVMDLRVILISDEMQAKIAARVPWATVYFSPSCKCRW